MEDDEGDRQPWYNFGASLMARDHTIENDHSMATSRVNMRLIYFLNHFISFACITRINVGP